jgi:hypothetical protein
MPQIRPINWRETPWRTRESAVEDCAVVIVGILKKVYVPQFVV